MNQNRDAMGRLPTLKTLLTSLLGLFSLVVPAYAEEKMLVYIATVPDKSDAQQGIYKTTLDTKTGALTSPELVIKTNRSSFITIHPNGRFLYACNEIGDFQGKKTGAASAFSIDDPETGKLTPINDQPSGGQGPCYVRVDASGKNLLVANYGGGSVAVLPIDVETGKLAAPSAAVQHVGN
ncbi:MAG: beta-propeller fold lactonase family protein, partial [Chthoniobacterales bacterium]|nr:beta-propeller fold lactonase family protein [Chthoniobacterales bacterium]